MVDREWERMRTDSWKSGKVKLIFFIYILYKKEIIIVEFVNRLVDSEYTLWKAHPHKHKDQRGSMIPG